MAKTETKNDELIEQLDGVYLKDTATVQQHITELEDTLNSYIYSSRYSNTDLEQQVNAWHDQLGFLVGATLSQLRRALDGDITNKTFVQRMKKTLEGIGATPESILLEMEGEPTLERTLALIKYVINLLKSRPPTLLWSCKRIPQDKFGRGRKSTSVEPPSTSKSSKPEKDKSEEFTTKVPESETDRPTVSGYRRDMSSFEKSQAEAERRGWRIENTDEFEHLYPDEISIDDGRDFVLKWLNAVEQPAPIVTLQADMVSKGFTKDELGYVIDSLYEDGKINIREHTRNGIRDLYIATTEFEEERQKRIEEREVQRKKEKKQRIAEYYTLTIPDSNEEPMKLERGDDVIEFDYYSRTGSPFNIVYFHDKEGEGVGSLTEPKIYPPDYATLTRDLSAFELKREVTDEGDTGQVIEAQIPEATEEKELIEVEPLDDEGEPEKKKAKGDENQSISGSISGLVGERLKDLSNGVSSVSDDEVEVETDKGIYTIFEVSDDLYRVTTPSGEEYYFGDLDVATNYTQTGDIPDGAEAYKMEDGKYIEIDKKGDINTENGSGDDFAQQLENAEQEYKDNLSEDEDTERWFEDKRGYKQVTLGGRKVDTVCYDKMTPNIPDWARKDYDPEPTELEEEIPICTISKQDIRLLGKRVIGDDGEEGLNTEQYTRVRDGLNLYMNGKVRRIGQNEWVVYGSEHPYVIGLRHGEYVHLDTFKGDWWYRQSGLDNWCKHIVAVHIANELDCDIDHEDGWGNYSGEMNVVPPDD